MRVLALLLLWALTVALLPVMMGTAIVLALTHDPEVMAYFLLSLVLVKGLGVAWMSRGVPGTGLYGEHSG